MTSSQPSVLVSHDMHVYAETLVTLLVQLRPDLDIQRVPPAELDEAVQARSGAIVVSSRLSSAVETHAGGWLLYYPDHANVAIVGEETGSRRIENPTFPDVLAALDGLVARVARLVSGRSTGGGCSPAIVPSVAEI